MARRHAWGARSIAQLDTVDPRLRLVCDRALEISETDIVALEGVRSPARQAELYAQGRTKPGAIVTWTKTSRHFPDPKTGKSRAVDLAPWPIDWNDAHRFDLLAKAMFTASAELEIPIRWGADWDRDGNKRERGESDSPHFELA